MDLGDSYGADKARLDRGVEGAVDGGEWSRCRVYARDLMPGDHVVARWDAGEHRRDSGGHRGRG